MSDPMLAAACAVALALVVGVAEVSRRLLSVPGRATRMTVHVASGVLAALAPLLFSGPLWPALVAASAVLVIGLARRGGHLPSLHAARPRSWGTVWFPAGALALYLSAWSHPHLVTIPLLAMAFADVAGVLVGEGIKRARPLPEGMEGKTWDGSVAVFATAGLAVSLGWEAFGLGGMGAALLIGLALAPVAAAAEAVSRHGLDNMTIPLACALTLGIIEATGEPLPLLAAEGLGLVAALVAVRRRLLRPDGAVAAFLLTTWLLGGGGWPWTLPVVVFFMLSSLLSYGWTGRKAAAQAVAAKGARRDLGQVAANGGVPLVTLAMWLVGVEGEIAWVAFLAGVATATADTWGTEVGTALRSRARLITTGRAVPAGTSGGVTLAGSAAGVLGAVTIGLTGLLVYPPWLVGPVWKAAAAGVAGGCLGTLLDSLLGATLQGHWRTGEGEGLTERPPGPAGEWLRPARGLAWMTNDAVNLLAAVGGAGLAVILWSFL